MAKSKPGNLWRAGLVASGVLAGSAVVCFAGGAFADGRSEVAPLAGADPVAPAPVAPAPGAASPVEVIFTGFARRMDKGASVFVRMTGEVPVSVEHTGRRFVYRLAGARLGVKNNANPLPTGQFGPPVSNVALVAANGAVDVVIDLTSDPGEKAPAYRVVVQSGIATLVIELPPASE
jgi:hypothetical protein